MLTTRVRIIGDYIKSNCFVRRGVVVDADVGFVFLVGMAADDLWPLLYRLHFTFEVHDEGHDDYLGYVNDVYRNSLKKQSQMAAPPMNEMEARMIHGQREAT